MRPSSRTKTLYFIVGGFIFIYLLFKLIFVIGASLFFSSPDRLNILVYGPSAKYYSIDSRDKIHYVITFSPELKVDVPGGYGKYRTGSLGKLVSLEKNPDIFKKTFSVTTSTFVHFYFYKQNDEIYYEDKSESEKFGPSIATILTGSSNASIFDRIYIAGIFLFNKADSFNKINYSEEKNTALDNVIFKDKSFIKDSLGLLYGKSYRDEQKSLQIKYSKVYKTAKRLGAMLEGNGIRVSDITYEKNLPKCKIIEATSKNSNTAKDMSRYFNCPIEKGNTDVYDIIFVLGSLENTWEINE